MASALMLRVAIKAAVTTNFWKGFMVFVAPGTGFVSLAKGLRLGWLMLGWLVLAFVLVGPAVQRQGDRRQVVAVSQPRGFGTVCGQSVGDTGSADAQGGD